MVYIDELNFVYRDAKAGFSTWVPKSVFMTDDNTVMLYDNCLTRPKVFEFDDKVRILKAKFMMSAIPYTEHIEASLKLRIKSGVVKGVSDYNKEMDFHYNINAVWYDTASVVGDYLTLELEFVESFSYCECMNNSIPLVYGGCVGHEVELELGNNFSWLCLLYPELLNFALEHFYVRIMCNGEFYNLESYRINYDSVCR